MCDLHERPSGHNSAALQAHVHMRGMCSRPAQTDKQVPNLQGAHGIFVAYQAVDRVDVGVYYQPQM